MLQHVFAFTVPAAYALLTREMASPEATAMLLAVGTQESRFEFRRQIHGPAGGFWQFEVGGVQAVLNHHATQAPIVRVLQMLKYEPTIDGELIQPVLEDNDVLACCFARCLLWASPLRLGGPQEARQAWDLYLSCWRPGKPHVDSWADAYTDAWDLVLGGRTLPTELHA